MATPRYVNGTCLECGLNLKENGIDNKKHAFHHWGVWEAQKVQNEEARRRYLSLIEEKK